MTSCNETVGVLDGYSYLHRNCIDSDMNIINSWNVTADQVEAKNLWLEMLIFLMDVRLNMQLIKQSLQSSRYFIRMCGL